MSYKEYTVKVFDNGDVAWYKPGALLLHREDGPAFSHANGDKIYYFDGFLHREDGPAIENADGHIAYYINNMPHTKEQFDKYLERKNKPSCEAKVVEIDGKKYQLTEMKGT